MYYKKPKPFVKFFRILTLVIGGLLLAGLFGLVFGYFVMLLWNWLMPAIFGLGTITFWQAFGVIVLAKLIFAPFGGHHPHKEEKRDHFRNWVHGGVPPWKTKCGNGFSKWKYYHEYWEDEGKNAYDEYVKRKDGDPEGSAEK